MAYSPDGKYLVGASGIYKSSPMGEVKVWDAATGAEVRSLGGYGWSVWSVAFSPNGKRLVTTSGRIGGDSTPGEVKIWDLVTMQEVYTYRGHAKCVFSAGYSPNGRLIISGGVEGSAHIWGDLPD